jgi:hypothetical protein
MPPKVAEHRLSKPVAVAAAAAESEGPTRRERRQQTSVRATVTPPVTPPSPPSPPPPSPPPPSPRSVRVRHRERKTSAAAAGTRRRALVTTAAPKLAPSALPPRADQVITADRRTRPLGRFARGAASLAGRAFRPRYPGEVLDGIEAIGPITVGDVRFVEYDVAAKVSERGGLAQFALVVWDPQGSKWPRLELYEDEEERDERGECLVYKRDELRQLPPDTIVQRWILRVPVRLDVEKHLVARLPAP